MIALKESHLKFTVIMFRNYLLFFVVGLGTLCSCSNTLDGELLDNIKLSESVLYFSSDENSATVTTTGEEWQLDKIFFLGALYSYDTRTDLDLLASTFLIDEDQFVVERKNKTTLAITLKENVSKEKRQMRIQLKDENYLSTITIFQEGKGVESSAETAKSTTKATE